MIIEQTEVTAIAVAPNGEIEVHTLLVTKRDGVESGRTSMNTLVLPPGANLTGQPARVQAVANAVWTPEVLAAWAGQTGPRPTTQAEAADAVQKRLDTFAQERAYDGILSACTYTASAVAKFAAEANYCVQARDAHWAKCYEILGAVEAGARAVPTLSELMAEMPPLAWPV